MSKSLINGVSAEDTHYMGLALIEAKKGLGRTSPNPSVGCVIVKDGDIVGRGYHKRAGTPHAEIHALNDAGLNAKDATAYVTLEPCSHTGRTGPCCVALAQAGVKRVVIGMMDPNPLVDGGGAQYLIDHDVEVCAKVREDDCVAINHAFIKKITTGLPFIIMKAGVSIDGRLNYQAGCPGWITGPESSKYVHQLRDQVDAIMVGRGTVDIDNPSLTTRLVEGEGQNPRPIIIDSRLETSLDSKFYVGASGLNRPVIVCQKGLSQKRKDHYGSKAELVEVTRGTAGLDMQEAIVCLGKLGINSILVEGGARLHAALLKDEIYDYAYVFHAPVFAGDKGVPLLHGHGVSDREATVRIASPHYEQLGEDMLISGELKYPK